jgi:hypothetical protein
MAGKSELQEISKRIHDKLADMRTATQLLFALLLQHSLRA